MSFWWGFLPVLARLLAVVSALPPLPRSKDAAPITRFQQRVDHWHRPRQDSCAPQLPPGAPPPPWPPPPNPPPWLPTTCPWPPNPPPWVTQTSSNVSIPPASTTDPASTQINTAVASSTLISSPTLNPTTSVDTNIQNIHTITSIQNANTSTINNDNNTTSGYDGNTSAGNQKLSNNEIPVWGIIVIALASLAVVLAVFAAVWWWRWRQLYNQHKQARQQQEIPLVQDDGSLPGGSSTPPSTTAAAAIKDRYLASLAGEPSNSRRNSLPLGNPYDNPVPSIKSFVSGGTMLSIGAALSSPRGGWATRTTLPTPEEHELRRRAASITNSELTFSTNVMFDTTALSDNGHPMAPSEPVPPANTGIPS